MTRWTTLAAILTTLTAVGANPLIRSPSDTPAAAVNVNRLFGRSDCANPCGWAGQVCCGSNEQCYTDSNSKAQCTAAAATRSVVVVVGGHWSVYTTRVVQTDVTTVLALASTFIPGVVAAPTATVTVAPSCDTQAGESLCGSICCASDQYCVASGQCGAAAAGSSDVPKTNSDGKTIATFLPPVAATAIGSNTVAATTTVPFETPIATGVNPDGSSATVVAGGVMSGDTSADGAGPTEEQSNGGGGLSPGAIAGIVIGSIAGLVLLVAICVCCVIKGLCGAICGRRRRRGERDERIEERRSDYYAGGRRSSPSSRGRKALGIGAALAALAAFLGFRKREQDRTERRDMRQRRRRSGHDYDDADYGYKGPRSPRGDYSDRTHYAAPPRSARAGPRRTERMVDERVIIRTPSRR